jgi:tyrosine-protein kinase Etk/Wzc
MTDPRLPAPTYIEDDGDEISLQDLWHILLRQRWLILGTFATVLLLTGVYTWRQKPRYEGEATLRIDEQASGSAILGDLAPFAGAGAGGGKLETEMLVLRSRQIAAAVADSLALHLRLLEPSRPRSEVLAPIHVPTDLTIDGQPLAYQLTRAGDGSYAIRAEKGVPAEALPDRVEIGKPFSVGGATLALVPALRQTAPEKIRFEIRPFRETVTALREDLRVSRADPNAHIVAVRYQSTDAQLAAAVPNAASTTFIEHKTQGGKAETRSTIDFLREQVAGYENELRAAEERLRAFREQQQVVSLREQASQQVQRLAELQAQRDGLHAERQALAELLGRVGSKGASAYGTTSPYRQLASFPSFLTNGAVQDILQSLTHLENERAKLLVGRTAANLDVQGINNRIQELELQLYQLAQNYLASLDSQIGSAQTALAHFGAQIETIPAREVEFARLSREQTLLADLYTLLQTRLKEAELREAIEPGDVRVIDPALVPQKPVGPRRTLNLMLGGMLGLMLGVGAALLRQALDTKVRTREDVEHITGGAPVIGTIPRIRDPQAGRLVGAKANGNGHRQHGTVAQIVSESLIEARLVTHLSPRSPASEAYRALRTNLTFASVDAAPHLLVVTSAMPGDGKSTSSANLAITFAQQGTRALLVDADLRKGVLHSVFGMPQEPGFTQLLVGKATLAEAVRQVPTTEEGAPLSVLTAGTFPPNPAELLGSPRMRALIEQLHAEYEIVIFDAPPLNLVTDAAILGTMADRTILVTRAGQTEKGALEHAISQLTHLRVPFAGVVINDIDLTGDARYYGYAYGYGYGVAE